MTKSDFTAKNHHELELKFAAVDVPDKAFLSWCYSRLKPTSHKFVEGVDEYYRRGKHVLRYRTGDDGTQELTVKLRTSERSIADRVEVDIPLGASASQADVRAFLLGTGWREDLRVYKASHIVHVMSGALPQVKDLPVVVSPPAVLAIYVAAPLRRRMRRFLEVELSKDPTVGDCNSDDDALAAWKDLLQADLGVGDPVKDSLYEMFTGRRYAVVK